MNLLYVTSECAPFSKSGGLADVMGDLPRAMVKKSAVKSAVVITPGYRKTMARFGSRMVHQYDMKLDAPYDQLWAHLYRLVQDGVEYFLLDIPGLFDRDDLYGYGDDTYRFAAFSNAVVRFIIDQCQAGRRFDIVHCNDWQTGFVPLLVKRVYWNMRCILTIHNPAYQGWLAPDQFWNTFHLPFDLYTSGNVRLGESVNFLKTGIFYADAVNTVSAHHAQELISDGNCFGGIGWALRAKGDLFVGITNGLSDCEYNPMRDMNIPLPYSYRVRQEGKSAAREAAMRSFSLTDRPGTPLFVAISRLTAQKGLDRLWALGDLLRKCGGRLMILGSGDYDSEGNIYRLQSAYPENVSFWRGYDNGLAHLLYAAGDFFVMPSRFEPCGLSQLIAMRYGTVPIVSDAGGLCDTVLDASQPHGRGFVFGNWSDREGLQHAVSRALLAFQDPRAMAALQFEDMYYDSSWTQAAQEYLKLYQRLM